MATQPLLPFDYTTYASTVASYVQALKAINVSAPLDWSAMDSSVRLFSSLRLFLSLLIAHSLLLVLLSLRCFIHSSQVAAFSMAADTAKQQVSQTALPAWSSSGFFFFLSFHRSLIPHKLLF